MADSNAKYAHTVEGRLVREFDHTNTDSPIKSPQDAQAQARAWQKVADGGDPKNWQWKAIRTIKDSTPEFTSANNKTVAAQMVRDWRDITEQIQAQGGTHPQNLKHVEMKNESVVSRGLVNEKNQKVGNWIDVGENGKVRGTTEFKNGVKDGLNRVIDANGQLVSRGQYTNGVPTGVHRTYENGRPAQTVEYSRDGKILKQHQDNEPAREREQNQNLEYGR